jgi:FtsH-binding integral membrane protein
VQWDPTLASVSKIAAGGYDSYLRSFADSVRGFRHPVVIGFGHEMNAYWYSWGYGHLPASTFVVAGGMFGSLALYGTMTRRNLGAFGQFMFMGLIGLVLASLVGVFWHNDGLQFMISFVGVLVFAGLTVYDAQRLKSLAFATDAGSISGATIVGALALYLDFINLFLFLLRFLGGRRR